MGDLPDRVRSWYQDAAPLDDPALAGSPLARLRAINPLSVAWLAEHGVDLAAGDMVEVAPAVQHFQGGVKIRTHGDASIRASMPPVRWLAGNMAPIGPAATP